MRRMSNRRLTPEELLNANALLSEVRERLQDLSGEDNELLFAYRRKVYKELTYDERSKPMHRRRLKLAKMREQEGLCFVCRQSLPEKYSVLDRHVASAGYTAANTVLIHQGCDAERQASRSYA